VSVILNFVFDPHNTPLIRSEKSSIRWGKRLPHRLTPLTIGSQPATSPSTYDAHVAMYFLMQEFETPSSFFISFGSDSLLDQIC